MLRREREGGFTLRHLAELADAFARVRARHPLLLDLVPSRCEKPVSSVEARKKGKSVSKREEEGRRRESIEKPHK